MKSSHASLAVFSGLAAIVTADALPPEDIPVQCATICGPIVELTAECNVHSSRLLKRRRVNERAWVPKLAVEPKLLVPNGGVIRDDDRVEKRDFSVIVQAPTSFPPDVVPATTLDLEPTSKPTRINPVVEQPSSTDVVSSPPAATTTFADTTLTVPSTTLASTASLQTDTNAGDLAEQKGWAAPEGAEEECVCLNDSFDVASVTALCASCISQNGDTDNNVDVILSTCNFSTLNYTTSKDALVDNVRVQATLPSAAWGENAALDGAAARIGGSRTAAVMAAVGVMLSVCLVL